MIHQYRYETDWETETDVKVKCKPIHPGRISVDEAQGIRQQTHMGEIVQSDPIRIFTVTLNRQPHYLSHSAARRLRDWLTTLLDCEEN